MARTSFTLFVESRWHACGRPVNNNSGVKSLTRRFIPLRAGALLCLLQVAWVIALSAEHRVINSNTHTSERPFARPTAQDVQRHDPALLSYHEIIKLYEQEFPPAPVDRKLRRLLTTAFVNNRA